MFKQFSRSTQFMVLCCGVSLLSLLPLRWQGEGFPDLKLFLERSLPAGLGTLSSPPPYIVTETPLIPAETESLAPPFLRSFYPLETAWTQVWIHRYAAGVAPNQAPMNSRQARDLLNQNRAVLAQRPELIVDLSDRRLYVYTGQSLKKSYPIAIGQADWETPQGVFTVMQKQKSPSWKHPLTGKVVPPGEDNPLGVAWIGFWFNDNYQIGFHGTAIEAEMGEAISHGCVRLRNADILELYEQVEEGWVVTVRE